MPSPGDLPDLGIKLGSHSLKADSLPTDLSGKLSKKKKKKKAVWPNCVNNIKETHEETESLYPVEGYLSQ